MIGIYMIRNKINNKIYIGQSIDVLSRLKNHKDNLNKNRHINFHLQNSWNKYGESNFEFKPILECEQKELNMYEQYFIFNFESYNDLFGYNQNYGGNSGMMPLETKSKISQSMQGEKNPFYGKTHSDEVKRKLKEINTGENNPRYGVNGENHPMYGKHHSEESKQKISEKLTGTHYQKEGKKNPNSKIIYCIELGRVFYGIKSAGRELGIAPQSITACVNKRRKSAGKGNNKEPLHWVYYDEYFNY